ncbi:hypothetical protein B0J17DRAFT_633919 [Rhizoctonia solani]|nr:hypothetical protein B0J17DRAFT_633919 [Rhizoctonia solani]
MSVIVNLEVMHDILAAEITDTEEKRKFFDASLYPCARPVVYFELPRLDDSYEVSDGLFTSEPRQAFTSTFAKSHRRPTNVCDTLNEWGIEATIWFMWDNKYRDYVEWALWVYASRLHDLSMLDFNYSMGKHDLHDLGHSPELHQTSKNKEEMRRIVLEGGGLLVAYVRRAFSRIGAPPLLSNTIDESLPTVIKKGFSEPVESRLPYRVVTRPQFLPTCEDWFIDGKHIIGLYIRPRGRIKPWWDLKRG